MRVQSKVRASVAHMSLLLLLLVGACDSGGGDGPPKPYAGSLDAAPECELSADCPSGLYCDLGRCFQACNTVDPCSANLVCGSRGRCAESSSAPADPPPIATPPANVVSATTTSVNLSTSDTVVMIGVSASDASATIRYRVDSQVSWLRIDEERGTFSGTLSRMLTVDRTGLAPGPHDGVVVVRTNVGDVTIPVHLEQSLTGTYEGAITFTSPRPLGVTPLRFDVRVDGGFAAIRVDSSRSPLFPSVDTDGVPGVEPVTTTAVVTGGTSVKGQFTQVFKPADFGADAIFDRAIGRRFTFDLTAGANGGLSGTFEERWFGLMPTAVVLTGTVALGRQDTADVAAFAVGATPTLPANPSGQAQAISSACSSAAATAIAQSTSSCTSSAAAATLASCGDAMRTRGARLEGGTGLVIGNPSLGFPTFESTCKSEWPLGASIPAPSTALPQCVQTGNLGCSLSLHAALVDRGVTSGYKGVHDVVADYTGAALFLVNARLVAALELPYTSASSSTLATQVSVEYDAARSYGVEALKVLFAAPVLDELRGAPAPIPMNTEYVAVRRLAQLVSRMRFALEEKTRLDVRRGLVSKTALRDRIWHDGINLLASAGVLAAIESAHSAPPTAELSMLSGAVTTSSRNFLEVQDGATPFGLPPGSVPFIYDPSRPEPTNFEQNLHEASIALATATTAETAARDATRSYEQQVDTLQSEMLRVNQEHGHRLGGLCGFLTSDPSSPDLANCGANGAGELAEAAAQYEAAKQGVQIALERINALDARVQIQYDRLQQVQGVNASLIAFTDKTGRQINALEVKKANFELAKDALALAAQGSLFSPGGFFAAAASTMIGLKQIEIQSRADALQLSQHLAPLMADMDKTRIEGLTAIRDLLVSEAELNLEVAQSISLASAARIRAETVRQEVSALKAELDMNLARLSDTTRPLANNAAYRVVRDEAVLEAARAREEAIRKTYLAALAFEFETNVDHPAIDSMLLPALRASDVQHFADVCLLQQFGTFRQVYGARQSYVDEVSLREDILGIRSPVKDPITGATVSEAEQFRLLLLAAKNRLANGTVQLGFATALTTDNGLFSTNVCNDQLKSVQVRVIGDGLGDDQATVVLEQRGAAFQRSCSAYRGSGADLIRDFAIPDAQNARAIVHAGVNTYPTSPADTQLAGRAVAASRWTLSIPSGSSEPRNSDLDVTRIEDIVLRFEHSAITINPSGAVFVPMCQ